MPRRKTKEEFINDAKNIWGDQFDYSKVEYVNNMELRSGIMHLQHTIGNWDGFDLPRV